MVIRWSRVAGLDKNCEKNENLSYSILSPCGLVLMTFLPNSLHHGSFKKKKNISIRFEWHLYMHIIIGVRSPENETNRFEY